MRCDDCLAVAGGVPIGRLEHVPLDKLHKGAPPVTETADDTADESTDDAPTVETDESETNDESNAEAQLRQERNLPDDVPLFIKIDLGRDYGWAEAEVTKVKGRWLHYALRNGNEKRGNGKVQLIGRDILWQPSAAPADEATAIAGDAQ